MSLLRTRVWFALLLALPAPTLAQDRPEWVLVMHGGAGSINRGDLTAEEERAHRDALSEALGAGAAILQRGGSSLDAVEAAIRVLEDSPHYNAGRGAVLTSVGTAELDASIMDGATRGAGAVAGVRHVRNPISLARLVMEESVHVMLAREGAEEFALEQGIELVPAGSLVTDDARRSLERVQRREAAADSAAADSVRADGALAEARFGTVGAVALDAAGHLAAGTSTGGMTNKRWGRIGDSPIIGAGTYADDEMGCAISGTGHGEFFIRNAVAHDICARAHYLGIPLRDAADQVVMQDLVARGGEGGVIALDGAGTISMPFNTSGMFRGFVTSAGETAIEIYRD